MKLFIFSALIASAACGPSNNDQSTQTNALVGSDHSDQICDAAGIANIPTAESYHVSIYGSREGSNHLTASASFQFDAPFHGSPNEVVKTSAPYYEQIFARPGKTLRVSYSAGIANLKHSTEDFSMYLGYLVNGQAKYLKMEWSESPTTTYTRYDLNWEVPAFPTTETAIWFEGRYLENGSRKISYDSKNGSNYPVTIVNDASNHLCFTKDGRFAITDTLNSGSTLDLTYDVGKLIDRMAGPTYAAWPAWRIHAHYIIVNNQGHIVKQGSVPVFAHAASTRNGSSSTTLPSYKPSIRIPDNLAGGNLQLWFEGKNRGPTVWDSDNGRNFTVGIVR